jgi:hypothetical protein
VNLPIPRYDTVASLRMQEPLARRIGQQAFPRLAEVSVSRPRAGRTGFLPSVGDVCKGRIDSPCPAPRGGRPHPDRGREMECDVEH